MPGDMRSRRYIGVVVSALLILAVLLIFTDPWSTIRNDGKRIVLANPGSVDRITITDEFDSTLLIKKDHGWWLYGEEETNPVAVENLLFAAERLQINSILTDQSGSFGSQRRIIRFYSGERRVLAYELFSDGEQYMLHPEGSARTYYVSVSGFTGLDLNRVFSTAANHYRQHLLIDLLPSEISLIEIELSNGHSFRFTQDPQGEIVISGNNEQTPVPSGKPDELAVRLLFSYFTAIRFEGLAGIMKDELENQGMEFPWLARLHVESREGENHTLRIYPYYPSEEGERDMFRALVLYNNEPEALVVNYIYLDVLMRDLTHYF
jgi:hypothetical protein